jgi:hypothetical protein
MKRRVFSKTTPFHVKKEEEKRRKRPFHVKKKRRKEMKEREQGKKTGKFETGGI